MLELLGDSTDIAETGTDVSAVALRQGGPSSDLSGQFRPGTPGPDRPVPTPPALSLPCKADTSPQ